MLQKKWKIPGLKPKHAYCEGAVYVIIAKLSEIYKLIDMFFENDSDEVLHDLRIAVRKLRYNMEIFGNCFDKKSFFKVYKLLKNLQDLIGEGRDLDVMREKVESIGKEINAEIPQHFFDKIDSDRIIMRQKIKTELLKFKSDKKVLKYLNKGKRS
jgi:CHAD domain-containing protein